MTEQKIVLSPRMAADFEGELEDIASSLSAALPDTEVEVQDPSTAPPGFFGLELGEVLMVILPFTGEHLASTAIDIIIEKLRAARKKRRDEDPPPRIVKIYGPNGEVLKTVEIDDGE
jgi:hypothetical protein